MAFIISGSVSHLSIHVLNLVREEFHKVEASAWGHFHTCKESSIGSKHLGHAAEVHSFHCLRNFPTPHIPTTHFVMNMCLESGLSFSATPVES
jgi:hypothetical protein